MNEKKECKIVQDLLPNYIEKVTTEETNNYIENHLKNCSECQAVYASMTENLNAKPTIEEKEVRYMKKFHKQLKVLKIILLIIVLFFVFSIGRKTYILCSLGHKWEETEKQLPDNYYVKTVYYGGETIEESTCYSKGEDYMTVMKFANANGQKGLLTHYQKDGENLFLSEGPNKEWAYQFELQHIISIHLGVSSNLTSDFIRNIQLAPFIKIETLNIDDKECYVIKYRNQDDIIDKETGITIKTIHYENHGISTTETSYEFGIVKDSDIQRPDTTGYKIIRDEAELR